jgi:glycosyltransferase involved in cell wall biosynthesis
MVIPDDASYPTTMSGTVRIRFRGETDLSAMRRLCAVIGEFEPDLVHAHTGHAHTWASIALALKRSETPLVVSRRVLFTPSRNPVSKWKMRHADVYICVSGAVAGVLRDCGIPDDRLRVVHSGVPVPEPAGDPLLTREELGIPRDAVVAVNLAAFTPNKNQATLVCALSLMPPEKRPFCVLAGEGKTRVRTGRLVKDLELGQYVIFPGFLENPAPLLQASDIFVLPSVSEGLSTAAIEAMACALPVVATRCGGIEDVVADGETGILVSDSPEDLASALTVLVDDREKRRSMGEAGRDRSSRFSVDRMVEGTLSVYRSLV